MKTAKTGAFLATAVGLMFMANVAMAQGNGAVGGGSATSAPTAKVKCMGANGCKGHSPAKLAQNDCKGQNACKGKGFLQLQALRNACKKVGTRQPARMLFDPIYGARTSHVSHLASCRLGNYSVGDRRSVSWALDFHRCLRIIGGPISKAPPAAGPILSQR